MQQLARDLLEPLVPHFSPGRARVQVGANLGHFGATAGWLEGYARPLWGLAPLAAGGGDFARWQLWQEGLAAGVDPAHEEYWGLAGDYDQRSVEQAAFGFALALAPEKLWEPASAATRARLVAWLRRIDDVQLVRSNWLFFRILVHLGLRRVGVEAPEDDEDLALIESFHRGGGWYHDGAPGAPWRDGRTGDYYIPMAFQFYGLLYASMRDDRWARVFRKRAVGFAEEFQYWFAADGSALPFGRSLTYRCAQGAFWGALAYAGIEALPWPVIKGLHLRHLRWWMRQPIFGESGLLTIGYAYPGHAVAESYNSSQSPYWALKALLPLALPESHSFWQADEAPFPARAAVRTVPGANLVLTTDAAGDVTAINPGQPVLDWPRNAPHKYAKCAYSTRFGFSLPLGAAIPAEGGFDSDLALSDDGRFFRRRDFCEDATVENGIAYSRWSPWPDVTVCTWLIADAAGHARIHRVCSGRGLWALEAGFAAPWDERASLEVGPGFVRTPAGVSAIRDLAGGREAGSVDLGAGSHVLAPLASMPVLRSRHEIGAFWLACWVSGGRDASAESPFMVEIEGMCCRVERDGEVLLVAEAPPGS
jgi:hypothetical protein